jgi:hypothetical protein
MLRQGALPKQFEGGLADVAKRIDAGKDTECSVCGVESWPAGTAQDQAYCL